MANEKITCDICAKPIEVNDEFVALNRNGKPPEGIAHEKCALIEKTIEDGEKIAKLGTEDLLDLLPEPGSIDGHAVLIALFQRNALYRTLERYPESKEEIITYYNEWCRMLEIYRSLPPPSEAAPPR